MSLRILLCLVVSVTATPVDDASALVQNVVSLAGVDAEEDPWTVEQKEIIDFHADELVEEEEVDEKAGDLALVKQEARRTQQLMMRPVEDKEAVKKLKEKILVRLQDPQVGFKKSGLGPMQRRVAMRRLLKMATDVNPKADVVEQYKWVADYLENFVDEKAKAQVRVKRSLGSDFSWENAESVKLMMRDWKVSSAPIIPAALLKAKNPKCFSHKMDANEKNRLMTKHIATKAGEPNLRAWCLMSEAGTLRYGSENSAKYAAHTVLNKCILQKKPLEAAHSVQKIQRKASLGMMEASYCFMEGHCNSKALNSNSTFEDAQLVCDMRHGHEAWTGEAVSVFNEARWKMEGLVSKEGGISDSAVSTHMGLMACAMGSYHCDAVLCQETYCKDEKYERHFKHLYGKDHTGRFIAKKDPYSVESASSELADSAESESA